MALLSFPVVEYLIRTIQFMACLRWNGTWPYIVTRLRKSVTRLYSAYDEFLIHSQAIYKLSYLTIPYCSTHWAIPLSYSALVTELSRYPRVLYPLSYLTIP